MRSALKATLERLLGSRAVGALLRGRLRGARLVLAYHNIVPDAHPRNAGDASLHLPLGSFLAQLDAIAAAGLAVVDLASPPSRTDASPEVALSFDDAYIGALALGGGAVAARDWPMTVFVAPGLLGAEATWWDQVAVEELGAIPEALRDRLLVELEGDGVRILAEARARGWRLSPPRESMRIASGTEVAEAMRSQPRLTIGAHSYSHPNLAAVPPERLDRELQSPLAWLRERWADRTVPWLAYPYGIEAPHVHEAVERAGYAGAFRVTGRWHRVAAARFTLPRLNVTPGISVSGFRARLSGAL